MPPRFQQHCRPRHHHRQYLRSRRFHLSQNLQHRRRRCPQYPQPCHPHQRHHRHRQSTLRSRQRCWMLYLRRRCRRYYLILRLLQQTHRRRHRQRMKGQRRCQPRHLSLEKKGLYLECFLCRHY